jgi:hypothetical protein
LCAHFLQAKSLIEYLKVYVLFGKLKGVNKFSKVNLKKGKKKKKEEKINNRLANLNLNIHNFHVEMLNST